MTAYPDLFAKLAAPFEPQEVKVRSQSGRQFHYITARTVMNRLDDVLGPENWWDEYIANEHSVLCRLTIRLPDGSILTKCDAGGYAGMTDSGDDDKSGYSDAFKRAAVKFGVARYLYRDGVPAFVRDAVAAQPQPAAVPDRDRLPAQGRPSPTTSGEAPRRPTRSNRQANGNGTATVAPPAPAPAPAPGGPKYPHTTGSSGRELYHMLQEVTRESGFDAIGHIIRWGRAQGFHGRVVDWGPEWTAASYEEVSRRLDEIEAESEGSESDHGEPGASG